MSAKKITFLFIFISLTMISNLSCNFFSSSGNKQTISISPVPAIAGQIENSEDLISALEAAGDEKERNTLLEENRDMVNPSLVIEIISKARDSWDEKTLSSDKSKKLSEIAIQISEFLNDKTSLAKALRFNSTFEVLEGKLYNPPGLERALELFIEAGDRKGEGVCYFFQAKNLYFCFGETEKAFALLDKAIGIFSERGDYLFLGDCFYLKGEIYRDAGDKEKSIENFTKAVEIYEKQGDWMSVFYCYTLMAITCETRGFLEEAEMYFEKERMLIEELNPEELGDFSCRDEGYIIRGNEFESKDKLMAGYYMSLGQLYSITGRYEEAIKAGKKAIEAGSKLDKTDFSEMMAYWSLAGIYSALGQKDRALGYYLEAIDKVDENTSTFLIACNYMVLGHFYLEDMKDPDKAIEYYEMAMEKSKEIEMTVFKDQYIALCIRFMGQAYEEKGDLDKAIEQFTESLEMFEKIYSDYGQFDYFLVWNYDLLGEAYRKKGDNDKALEYMNKAFDLAKKTNVLGNMAKAAKYLGDFYLETDSLPEALKFYLEAVKTAEETRSASLLWDYYFSLGKAYEKQGDFEGAYGAYLNSIEVIENMRKELKVEEFKRDFMQDKIEGYEHMIDLLIKMKKEEEAFNYNERARARAFLDILANQKVDITHDVSQKLLAKEEALRTRIQYLTGDIKTEKEKAIVAQRSAFIQETDEKLKDLKLEYERVLEEIKLENPEYVSLISVNPFSLKEIQSFLDEDTVIMEYFLGKERGFLWVTGNDTFNTVTIEHKRDEIEALVRDYREVACDDITVEKIGSKEWRDVSKKLYGLLFKDGEKFLSGKKRIIIAPHRILHYLPFQVLIDDREYLLIEKYEILYLPSASVLKFCQDKNHFKKDSLLAFEIGDFKVENLNPLPGTIEEVKNISSLFHKNEVYSGENMKVELLYEKANKFDILHFATHGIMDGDAPLFSGLVFADGRLDVYEIFDLNLDSYMVTLSACRTGMGEEANGDELVGLSRAFIYAGSPSICSSLWDVSDVSTGELMERFYYHLQDNNKSAALRLAQLDLQKKYSHPFFWAPFILTGDWR